LLLLDTIVLIASLDPMHPQHSRAIHHLKRVASEPEVHVPSAAILEMDLELKTHGFTQDERREAGTSLLGYVPEENVLPITLDTIIQAIDLERVGGYFDALIGSTAKLLGASVVSKDKAFTEMGLKIEW
jgi:predicted nucleic acid-binding protein